MVEAGVDLALLNVLKEDGEAVLGKHYGWRYAF